MGNVLSLFGYAQSVQVPEEKLQAYRLTLTTSDPVSMVTLKTHKPPLDLPLFDHTMDDMLQFTPTIVLCFWGPQELSGAGVLTVQLHGADGPHTHPIADLTKCQDVAVAGDGPVRKIDVREYPGLAFDKPLALDAAHRLLIAVDHRTLQKLCTDGYGAALPFLRALKLNADEWKRCLLDGPGCKRRMIEAIIEQHSMNFASESGAKDPSSGRQVSSGSDAMPSAERERRFNELRALPLVDLQSVCLAPGSTDLKFMNAVEWIFSFSGNRRQMLRKLFRRLFPLREPSFQELDKEGDERAYLEEFLELQTRAEPKDHVFAKSTLEKWKFTKPQIAFCCEGRSYEDQLAAIGALLDDRYRVCRLQEKSSHDAK